MPTYLFQGSYASDAVKEVVENGFAGRQEALEAALGQLGGRLESVHWEQGTTKSYVIAELPDDEAAHAMVLQATQGAGTASATRLLDASEAEAARARGSSFRSPGT